MTSFAARFAAALSLLAATGCTTSTVPDDAAAEASTSCTFSDTYSYGNNGGLSAAVTATLTPRATWSRVSDGSTPPPRTCTVPCRSTGAYANVEAVESALANSDVVAALTPEFPRLYGVDNRDIDGTAWTFTRMSDGHSFTVGDACGTTPGCLAIPPGVAALRGLLSRLDEQEGAQADCQ